MAIRGRALSGLAAICLLGGCSSQGSDLVPLYHMARQAIFGGERRVTLQEAAAVPYASMGVRVGNGPELMILLASGDSGQQLWTSAARIAITTRDGRIIRTAGFAHNLGGYDATGVSPGRAGEQTVRWQADFPDLGLYSVSIVCHDRQAGLETIQILGKDVHVRRTDETCTSEGRRLDWSFNNTYWIDPESALVWRSVQHVHPDLDPIETEILRPPG